jgi:CheY-like chemotaxis protein
VAEMLDIPAGTLRTWEGRYGLVVPERSAGGQRLYSRDQIEMLRFVALSIAGGLQPGDAHRLLADRMAEGTPLTEPAPEAPRLGILLAERDAHAANLADFFLRTEGYETVVVLDADEAEASFEREKPELVVVDLLLSDGKGLALCRKLKQKGQTRILAVSSLATRQEALAAGADAFLQKPLDPLQLVATVRDMMRDSALTRRRRG